MPLKDSDKQLNAKRYTRRYFPWLSPVEQIHVARITATQFIGDLSPIRRERQRPDAIGGALSFRDFVILVGLSNTFGKMPAHVSREKVAAILQHGGTD